MNIKKPKFWDKKKPNIISFLLLPFTLPVIINNFFLNNYSKNKIEKIFSICIGNIYLGGTGKTPTVIKLYEIIKSLGINVVTAKKLYKKQNDEIILLKNKTNLITHKNRLEIIKNANKNKNKVIIFDDGLQDKKINYDLKFVCFDSSTWIGNGQLIPSGPLRERIDSLKKYDAVIVKNLNKINHKIIHLIKNINPNIKIFNSKFKITNLKNFNLSKKYLIFSGIGNVNSFKDILKKNKFKIIDEIYYPDHYEYLNKDIYEIIERANKLNAHILTTEKDFVKISQNFKNKIKFLKVELEIEDRKKLTNFLKSKIYA